MKTATCDREKLGHNLSKKNCVSPESKYSYTPTHFVIIVNVKTLKNTLNNQK